MPDETESVEVPEQASPEDIEAHQTELQTAEEEQDELLVLLRENAEIMAEIRDEMRRYHTAQSAPESAITEPTIVERRKDETPSKKSHKSRGMFY